METLTLANAINEKIATLKKMRAELKDRSVNKANSIAVYERELAKIILKLRNGEKLTFEGQEVESPPVTIIEKIARGICWNERLEMETADALYRSLITNIDCVQAELNGLQSINRYLSEM